MFVVRWMQRYGRSNAARSPIRISRCDAGHDLSVVPAHGLGVGNLPLGVNLLSPPASPGGRHMPCAARPSPQWPPRPSRTALPICGLRLSPLLVTGHTGLRASQVHRKLFTARSPQAHADTPSQTQLFRPLRTHQEGRVRQSRPIKPTRPRARRVPLSPCADAAA